MKYGLPSALALLAALGWPGSAPAQEPTFTAPEQVQAVPGEFIVKFREDAAMMAAGDMLAERGIETVRTLDLISARVIQLDPAAAVTALTEAVAGLPGVAYVEPNYLYHATKTPSDPRYGDQWAWPKIQAPAAWDVLTDSPDVTVAVIDTGVDYKHPDLSANMWKNPGETPGNGVDDDGNGIVDDVHGANFVPSSPTGDPMDDNRHGTHVAGTIGAVTDNNLGVAGTNWNTKIMALKFLSAQGSGSTADAIQAIQYAIDKGADIMNNSWGGGGFSQALEDAIKAANNQGILFAAAAGNTPTDNDQRPHYPSSYEVPNVLAVMASNEQDNKAGFSAFGAKSVDLAAPGTNILSSVPGGQYASFNGTSMATPHVAGAAALVKAQDPSRDAGALKTILMDSVDKLPSMAGRSVTEGRLNLAKALTKGPVACAGPTLVAYDEFFWSEQRKFDQNSNVLSVDFTLPKAMIVEIFAHGSARRIAGSGGVTTFRTGVYTQPQTNVMWTGSYRRGSYAANDVSRTVSSEFAIELPKGKHTMYWKLWVHNFTMQFDSASLMVRAYPCSMGGKLAATGGMAQAAAASPITTAEGEDEAPGKAMRPPAQQAQMPRERVERSDAGESVTLTQ